MRFDIISAFPNLFRGSINESILKNAREKDLLQVNIFDLRNFTEDFHRCIDDYQYGGGCGMVLKIEPIFKALKAIEADAADEIILFSARGETFNQNIAKELSQKERLVMLCGHYEGIDERVSENLITREISLGDFVLTGGELPAIILIDCVSRMLPGVLAKKESYEEESFYDGLLDYPHYTRPAVFNNWEVPDILLSGDHKKIEKWRQEQKFFQTKKFRPELLNEKDTKLEKNLNLDLKRKK